MSTVVFHLGEPRHGWLQVRLKLGSKEFEFPCSDAVNNPLGDLVDALYATASGHEASVLWFLEPGGYWFDFGSTGDRVEVRIYLGESMTGADRQLEASLEGPRSDVLLPFLRSVQRLAASPLNQPHWPPLDRTRLDKVRELLRAES